ncbi:MAG TPA: putative Ig domain-containing protein [Syntrophobacteria bacterium]|nr:putative Ig domain-containing protein [Syntrophobacteria bacterium]
MYRGALLVLLASALLGCGEQPGAPQQPAATPGEPNTAPAIVAVRVLPETPTPQSTLEARVRFSGGQPGQVTYEWRRNGSPIPGANGPTLAGESLRKGDFISVQVRVGQSGGEGVKSDAVVIGNTAPVVEWVGITPLPATSGSTLEAVVHGTDRDQDQLSYAYRWLVNGETVVGQHEPSLDRGYFRRGDRVQVAAAPFDGSNWGKETISQPTVIGNSPPLIVSIAPERLESMSYRYEVKAEDADGDPLRFSLRGNAPPGMKIDEATGVIEWQVVIPKEPTTWEYEVVVEDPEGLKSIQKIKLTYKP